ncbi:VOC family protein [Chitinimonas lacunae]|uniref:VOC family protein n=1 Tax=Chitinimonas lacunae TaxID=1963018 RepID=A0ABV8MQS5_9NEIS
MPVLDLDHFNLQVPAEQLELLCDFYCRVIGLQDGQRPLRSQGRWLYAGDKALVHLSVRPIDFCPAASTGHFGHIAFSCRDLTAMLSHLDQCQVTYDVKDRGEQTQVFLNDPCGVLVELNFNEPLNPTP